MSDLWVTAILVFLAAVFGTFSLALLMEGARSWWRRRQVARRLDPVLTGRARRVAARGDVHDLIRAEDADQGFWEQYG